MFSYYSLDIHLEILHFMHINIYHAHIILIFDNTDQLDASMKE